MITQKGHLLFLNIAPFSYGGEKELAQQMVEYTRLTGNRIVLYSLSMHPEGLPASEKAEKYIASYRRLKAELEGTDVMLGVLLQSILGHWPRTDRNEENWTRTINIDGQAVRYCPFDQRFREYIKTVVTSLAKGKPCLFLTDDDIRAFSHRPECFCPLHTAEFNRRLKTDFTSDQLREKVSFSMPGEAIYDTFQQLQRDTVNGLLCLIRECIDSVDPDIPAGTCCAGEELRFCGETAKCIAGKHTPFFRMANAEYLEVSPKSFPATILRTQQRQAHADIPIVLDEADTFPHHLYSRSSTSFHAKLCSSIMCGLNGAKLWFVNASKLGKPVSKNYVYILSRNKGYYRTLAEEAASTAMEGIVIPLHSRFPKWHLAKNTQETFLESGGWGEKVFGLFGIPFQCSYPGKSTGIHAIAGQATVQRLTDDELRILLVGKLLVDGGAAIELCRRGYGDFLGIEATEEQFLFNREYACESRQFLPATVKGTPHFTIKSSAATVLSMLAYESYNQSGKLEDVAPGTVLFKNSLGGMVLTTSYHTNYSFSQLNPQRKEWLVSLLHLLNGSVIPGIVLNEQDTCALRRKGDNYDLLMLFNLNYDAMEKLDITSDARPSQVLKLTPDGIWQDMPFSYENNVLSISTTMHCYEALTLKIMR